VNTLTLATADAAIENALFLVIDAGIVLISLATVMCLYRIIKGPTLIDRGLASDTIGVQIAGLVLLVSIRFETIVTFDTVLIVSILGFVSTLAFAQFIGRRGAAQ
jgi:multisubunit Na+/H+ antiporter MnhF subunit